MKKIIAFLLAVMMLMSFAACGGNNNSAETTTEPDTTVEDTTVEDTTVEDTTEPEATDAPVAAEGITFFTVAYSENMDDLNMLTAYPNEDGTVYVEYMGDIRKVANMDAEVLATILAGFEASGLMDLNGVEEMAEAGEASGSMYVEMADGTSYVANYYGAVAEAFTNGYAAMDTCFQELTADIAEYVPEPVVMGEVAEGDKAALDAILSTMTLEVPDAYMIMGIAKDEYFAATVGLASDAGITSGVSFAPMMMSVAYSLNIVTLEDAANAETVAQDFVDNIDWLKWVCVQPSDALIAVKDNQVLCLMGEGDFYAQTVSAIEAAGWTTFQTLQNEAL